GSSGSSGMAEAAAPWYHGPLSRTDAENSLLRMPEGTFLVRDSTSSPGDYVLSCSENGKVTHYKLSAEEGKIRIDTHLFDNLDAAITFYMEHELEYSSLKQPLQR
uniref:Predicted protein n=1 Tax=Monosiga brevicollis TaxID=81824 RepID=UPI00084CE66A|nr:Chain A, Predicted protein [Monosiga brevicollis]